MGKKLIRYDDRGEPVEVCVMSDQQNIDPMLKQMRITANQRGGKVEVEETTNEKVAAHG